MAPKTGNAAEKEVAAAIAAAETAAGESPPETPAPPQTKDPGERKLRQSDLAAFVGFAKFAERTGASTLAGGEAYAR